MFFFEHIQILTSFPRGIKILEPVNNQKEIRKGEGRLLI